MLNLFGQLPLTGDISRDLPTQIGFFDKLGQTGIADTFRGIQNERDGLFNGVKTDLIDQFEAFEKLQNPSFNAFLGQSERIANEILPSIARQRELVNQQFGPEGELTGQANRFFSGLVNSVNNAIAGNTANAINQSGRTGASQSAINAAIQQARSAGINDLVKVQAEKLNQQQGLANNFLQLQDGLRQQTFDFNNQLIRNPLLELNSRVNQLASGLLGGLQGISTQELNELLRQRALQGVGSTATNTGSNNIEEIRIPTQTSTDNTVFENNGQSPQVGVGSANQITTQAGIADFVNNL